MPVRHPSKLCRGPVPGGAVQGIGWALNEEYIYDDKGKIENPGFLDYRIPVCSDVPMIDTVIVEVPNPEHPYGVRGVGETPIVPPWRQSPTQSRTPGDPGLRSCRCHRRGYWLLSNRRADRGDLVGRSWQRSCSPETCGCTPVGDEGKLEWARSGT
ncbi:MAG: hypothetical protein CM1200mP20_08930 [Pseudomonadota bacterium]|nr:MAG: hypothetical protein CM1200mP20_08930 [Pseudomonadota bacterium]